MAKQSVCSYEYFPLISVSLLNEVMLELSVLCSLSGLHPHEHELLSNMIIATMNHPAKGGAFYDRLSWVPLENFLCLDFAVGAVS